LLQGAPQILMEVQAHELGMAELGAALRVAAVTGLADFVEHARQGLHVEADDLRRAQTLIDQAPDQAQLVHLLQRIGPLPLASRPGCGKP
jgi:hypothetical protein